MDCQIGCGVTVLLRSSVTYFLFVTLMGCGQSLNSDKISDGQSQDQFQLSLLRTNFVSNWTVSDQLPTSGRINPYNFSTNEFLDHQAQGQIHTQVYPVAVTGVLLPERPIKNILDNKTWNPIKGILNQVFKSFVGVDDFGGLLNWVGLLEYPDDLSSLDFKVPDQLVLDYQNFNPLNPKSKDRISNHRLGYSQIFRGDTKLFTMSCATCHSDQLFGQTVFGMTKRFPRANEFFIQGSKALNYYNQFIFKSYTGANDSEMYWLDRSISNLKSVGHKQPLALGLDTSLAQVALSLKKREPNAWADKSLSYEKHPRADDILDHDPGDSKPAVWWSVKYKNRWLSDGSVVSGNPIYTNLLWNEIGRGTDLRELSDWLNQNEQIVKELTTAVFATEAPRIERFFDPNLISKNSALKGELIFNKTCAKCHGVYEKNWSRPEFKNQAWGEQIKTYQVVYPQPTPVVDVGTDPYRYLSMLSLTALNDLQISKDNKILIQAQKGYVPPPLVGIWARWPYMHNNSIPSLCALLSPVKDRPQVYYAVAPNDKTKDFDFECNGYPEKDRRLWVDQDKIYRVNNKGLGNQGHDEGIFIKDGKELLSNQDKRNLIQFMQTL
jgi:hypothetical protein